MRTSIAAFVIASTALSMGAARGEEWPRYRGPRGDGIVRDAKIGEKWPAKGPRERWRAEVGAGYASPIGVSDVVYAFALDNGKETLTAFAADSGKVLWREAYAGGWDGSYPGTRATPVVDGGAIYTLGGGGDLVKRAQKDGKLQWRVNVLMGTGSSNLQWGTASSPLVDGKVLYVQGGQGGPVALAIDTASGAVIWLSEARGDAGYATPIRIGEGAAARLIVFGGDTLFGMHPSTGKSAWSEPWRTSYGVNAAAPIHKDGLLFASSAYGRGSVMVRALPDKVEKVWQSREVATRFNAAILDGDTIYANSEGELKALGWKDGKLLWAAKKTEFSLGMGGSIVRAGDKLLMLGERGALSLARATPGGVQRLAQAQILDGSENWATPLVYKNRLYVKGETKMVCFDLPAQE